MRFGEWGRSRRSRWRTSGNNGKLKPQHGNLEEEKFEDIGELDQEEDGAPDVEMKLLPKGLKYEFLGDGKTFPVIVSDELSPEETDKLMNLLKKHKR